MTTYAAHGLRATVPDGWRLRIAREPLAATTAASTAERPIPRPIVHAATIDLPADAGSYGGAILHLLGPDDIFVALIEFDPADADLGLFHRRGMPRLAPSQFSPNRTFRVLPGNSAAQHFFTEGNRTFCLYVVVGEHSRRMSLVPRAAAIVRNVRITPGPRVHPPTVRPPSMRPPTVHPPVPQTPAPISGGQ